MEEHRCGTEIDRTHRCTKLATCYISSLDAWCCTIHGLALMDAVQGTEEREREAITAENTLDTSLQQAMRYAGL